MVTSVIDQNEFYWIWDLSFLCCDEVQFRYQCKKHSELMGCYYCEFDYSKECECEN
jgi:hypothetical protein